MGVFDNFPYTNYHDLNLDWIIKKIHELESKLATSDNSVNAMNLLHALAGYNLVCFGDSWGEGAVATDGGPLDATYANSRYSAVAATTLGMTEYNFAVNGAGYTRPSNLISTQILNAEASMSNEERYKTKVVTLIAGVNDIRHMGDTTLPDLKDAVVNAVNMVAHAFPNAVILLGFSVIPTGMTPVMIEWVGEASEAALTATKPVQIIDIQSFLCYRTDLYYSDLLHPNWLGHRELGNLIVSNLLGGTGLPIKYIGVPTPRADYTIDHGFEIFKIGNLIYINAGRVLLTGAAVVAGQRVWADLPADCEPYEQTFNGLYAGNNPHGSSCLYQTRYYANPDAALSSLYFPAMIYMAK